VNSSNQVPPLTIEQRLSVNNTKRDKVSHLNIERPDFCLECVVRECTIVCPANTYVWNEENQRIIVNFENCLECGTCRALCSHCNISWRNPFGGMGICYRY